MLAGRERIEGIQQIEVAWSRVPGAESTRLHTAHPKPVPLLLVHSLAHSPYPTFFLYRLFDSPSCPPADTHPHYSFPLIPFLTVISSLCFSSLLFSSLLFSSYSSSSFSLPNENFRYEFTAVLLFHRVPLLLHSRACYFFLILSLTIFFRNYQPLTISVCILLSSFII